MEKVATKHMIDDQRPYYMDRIDRLKERVVSMRPEMDLENAKILTASFLESEG